MMVQIKTTTLQDMRLRMVYGPLQIQLNSLQPIELVIVRNCSTFFTGPAAFLFSLYLGKGNGNVHWTQRWVKLRVAVLVHLSRNILSALSPFSSKIFQPF